MKHYVYESPFKMKDEKGVKYTLEVESCGWHDDPREWDNRCTMICWHNQYSLGDKHSYSGPLDLMTTLHREVIGESWFYKHTSEDWSDIMQALQESNLIHIKAIHLYDHGGLTVSTSNAYPYNDRWDSRTVGFIYVTKKKLIEECIGMVEEDWKERADQYIEDEMKTYDQYLRGDVYGFTLKKTVTKKEKCPHCGEVVREYEEEIVDDSCSGFYGDCLEDNGILDILGGLEFVEED